VFTFGLRAAKPVATFSGRIYVIEIFKPTLLHVDKFWLELGNINFCYNPTQPLSHIYKFVGRLFPTPFIFEIPELQKTGEQAGNF